MSLELPLGKLSMFVCTFGVLPDVVTGASCICTSYITSDIKAVYIKVFLM